MAEVHPELYAFTYVCDEPITDTFKAQFRQVLVEEERDTYIGYAKRKFFFSFFG